ncbi:MAG TPA: hypothetical protein VG028_18800 [Terriglobia bacterium]|nr:hypothetical protein [Terriglobia bacterium]
MKRILISISACALVLGMAVSLYARNKNSKPGPLTGTWECTSHGGSGGDMQFTLTLEQDKETVTGSVTSPIGSAELSNATYSKKSLEIHIDSDPDEYVLTGRLKGGKLSGQWTHGDEKGAWEGAKRAPASN